MPPRFCFSPQPPILSFAAPSYIWPLMFLEQGDDPGTGEEAMFIVLQPIQYSYYKPVTVTISSFLLAQMPWVSASPSMSSVFLTTTAQGL